MENILKGIKIINIGYNLPAPLTTSKLTRMGASVIKVEPPGGDPFKFFCPEWYKELVRGQDITQIDLKTAEGLDTFHKYLVNSDFLITSSRPSSLEKLGISWSQINEQYPKMSWVSIIGYPPPNQEHPGHDLTYQAKANLVSPPSLPKTLFADIFGSERVVQAVLRLVINRYQTGESGYIAVALSEVIAEASLPFLHGLTTPDSGILSGKSLRYNLYQTKQGWVALAALEEKLWQRFLSKFGFIDKTVTEELMKKTFLSRTALEWEEWAAEHNIPLASVP